jgi:hypothetical protein
MKYTLLQFSLLLSLIFSCKPAETREDLAEDLQATSESPDSTSFDTSFTQNDQENIQRLIRLTLTDLFKEDLEKGFLDSASRRFRYDQVDLNQDDKLEILVGLTGPYFCGSGGCTIYLLSNHGDVITRFTVVDYPVYVDSEMTQGWSNLVCYSGSNYRKVEWNGNSYPSNPSTLEIYAKNIEELPKLLDLEDPKYFPF